MIEHSPDAKAEFQILVRRVLRAAALELLQGYGRADAAILPAGHPCPASEFVLAAAVGFAGKSAHGTLALAVPQTLLDLLSPLQHPGREQQDRGNRDSGQQDSVQQDNGQQDAGQSQTGQPESLLCHSDWVGELANQLLGRVKNKLVPLGVDICLGTPAVVEGRELRLRTSGKSMIEQYVSCAGSVVCIWLDVAVADDFVISQTDDVTLDEGSVLLF